MRRRRHRTSIRRKLLRRTLLVALVPLLVTGAAGIGALVWLTGSGKASVSDSREELADEVISSDLSNRAAQLSRELAFFVIERVDDLRELGTDQLVSEAGSDDAAAVGDRLAAFAESHRDFTEITLAGPGGRIVASTDGAITGSVGREHWFEEATESGLDLTEASVGGDGLLSVRVAVGIDGGAALRAALDLSLVQRTADDIAGAASREVLVIDADGERIADTASGHDPDVILDPDGRVQLSKDLIAIQAMAFAGHERGTGALILSETSGGFSFLREDLSAAAAARGDALLADEAAEAFDWTVLVEQPTDVAFASLSKLEQLENDLTTSRDALIGVVALLLLAAGAAAAMSSLVFGRRLVNPIERLSVAARESSAERLPELIETAQSLEPGDELPTLEPIEAWTGDELEDLAGSIDSMQQTAARLAGEQIELRRRNTAATFVHLGRRNQKLLSRQLDSISALEKDETDEDTLARLFDVDHLATRMRRNAESLLVMAGEEPPRRWNEPLDLRQIVQASIAEVAQYQRVEILGLESAAVSGEVASTLAHLLAELVENALSFSPPDTTVEVYGLPRPGEGFRLAVVDSGIGMSEERMEELNEQLSDPRDFGDAPSSQLGLFVVGHLARRQGLSVRLGESALGGVIASVHIPEELLVAPAEVPRAAAGRDEGDADSDAAGRESTATATDQAQDPGSVGFLSEPVASGRRSADDPTTDAPPPTGAEEPVPAASLVTPLVDQAPMRPRGVTTLDAVSPGAVAARTGSGDDDVRAATRATRWMRDVERVDRAAPTETVSPPRPATTPSGFPMRTRGRALSETTPDRSSPRTEAAPARTPDQVRRSLSRYQVGVVLGAADARMSSGDDPTQREDTSDG